MTYYEERVNRREAIQSGGCLFAALSLVGLGALGIRGCINSSRQHTKDGYAEGRDELIAIAKKYYASYPDSSELQRKPDTPIAALNSADKALACFAALLQVDYPFDYRHRFINSVDAAKSMPDSCLNSGEVEELKEYQDAKRVCDGLKSTLSGVLTDSRKALQKAQSSGAFDQDPTANQYLNRLIPRLEILSQRMQAGKLMTGENVMQWTNKFGTFKELIGQAEHYEEARAEIKSLREHLQAK